MGQLLAGYQRLPEAMPLEILKEDFEAKDFDPVKWLNDAFRTQTAEGATDKYRRAGIG